MKDDKKTVCFARGARRVAIHSEAEFLRRVVPTCGRDCPAEGDVAAWMEWSGAVRSSPAGCRKIMANKIRMQKSNLELERSIDAFDVCVKDKCVRKTCDAPVAARCAVLLCAKPARRVIESEAAFSRVYAKGMKHEERLLKSAAKAAESKASKTKANNKTKTKTKTKTNKTNKANNRTTA
jgi:hypothetical protein